MAGFKTTIILLMLHSVTSAALVFLQQIPQKELRTDLAHRCAKLGSLPEDGVPVIMLHDITDTKDTWDGIYQNIPFLSHRRVCVYDARNHGDSPWNDTFNIDVLADDLASFMRFVKIERAALVGHGMGGLTALKFALKNPKTVESVFVEDISPVGIPMGACVAITSYLTALRNSLQLIPDNANEETARKAIIASILQDTKEMYNISVGDFPEKFPIHCRDGKWQWKMNIDVFMEAFSNPDKFLGKMEGRYDGKVFFVYGKNSLFRVDNDEEAIRKIFPNSEFLGIESAGHIIHTQHHEFFKELIKFLH